VSPAEWSPSRFLELLDERDRAALDGVARVRRYRRGASLMRQGDPTDAVCVVLEGRAKITVDTVDGRTIVLGILGPGDLVGEFEALFDVPTRSASIVALEPMVALVMSGAVFLDYLLAHPAASLALVKSTIRRLGAADRRRVGRTAMDSSYALARFLVEMIDRGRAADDRGVEVDIPLAQHELASLIGVSRNSMVRALSSLRSLGLVETTNQTVCVLDVDGLRDYVQSPPVTAARARAGERS
jgi:CRP/FNR family transcriptional regulator, cyclic AMP receptor protein